MQDNQKFVQLFNLLNPHIEELSKGSLKKESGYLLLLKSALIKNFEFNIFIWNAEPKYSFFNTSTLRGICEDIITLNFIGILNQEDRDELVDKLSLLNMFEACKTQANFFSKKKPAQPVFGLNKVTKGVTSEQLRREIETIVKKYKGWTPKPNGNGLPSIFKMAAKCDLKELYEYLYAATSRWVHFSPHILIRMGWGEAENNPDFSCKFSTEHFSQYYLDFTRFYATYLFIEFHETFADKLNFPEKFSELIKELKNLLTDTVRWPEIVTFEEMNIKPPPPIVYLLHHVESSLKDKDGENQ